MRMACYYGRGSLYFYQYKAGIIGLWQRYFIYEKLSGKFPYYYHHYYCTTYSIYHYSVFIISIESTVCIICSCLCL